MLSNPALKVNTKVLADSKSKKVSRNGPMLRVQGAGVLDAIFFCDAPLLRPRGRKDRAGD